MIDLNYLIGLCIIPVVIFCGLVGWVYKHLSKWDNRYIPLLVTVIGAIAGCIQLHDISISTITAGGISGIASTGLHQLFDTLFGGAFVSNGVREDVEYSTDEIEDMIEEDSSLTEPYED